MNQDNLQKKNTNNTGISNNNSTKGINKKGWL